MNGCSFTVRRANAADDGALAVLMGQLHPHDRLPDPELVARTQSRLALWPGSGVFVGQYGDRIVATAVLIVAPNISYGGRPFGLIENVITDQDFRRQGFGRALLAAVVAAAWGEDCYKVMLLTGSDSAGTHAFYRAAGFAQSKTGYEQRRVPKRDA